MGGVPPGHEIRRSSCSKMSAWLVYSGRSIVRYGTSSLLNYVNVTASGSLEEFIGLEGCRSPCRKCKCSSDENMQESITQLPGGSYEIRLPWKRPPDDDLPDNHGYAVKRQVSLENQFRDRSDEWEINYCQQMREQLDMHGVSRYVPEEQITT